MVSSKKIAFITGGTRGIGKAISVKFAKEGYDLALNYRSNEEEAAETEKECKSLGANVLLLKGDISDYSFCESAIKRTISELGSIDVLVNNAGITRDGLIMSMKEEDFDMVLDSNLKSAFLTIKFASRYMLKKRQGKIINIASISGLRGNVGQANYSSSKAGIIGLTKSIAKEFAPRGINVNAVSPGFIKTQMTDVLDESIKEKILSEIPLGTFGEPEAVADAVCFLASEESKYITGQVISVDGGMSI